MTQVNAASARSSDMSSGMPGQVEGSFGLTISLGSTGVGVGVGVGGSGIGVGDGGSGIGGSIPP